MTVYLGSDHRGFSLKEGLRVSLTAAGHTVHDLTPELQPGDDYPLVTRNIVEQALADPHARGIILCGSGAGVVIAANRAKGIRAALGMSVAAIIAARHDDDINVLALAADFTNVEDARAIAEAFLSAPFAAEERYVRRIQELDTLYG